MSKVTLCLVAILVLAGLCAAQSTMILFKDVKLYYQRPGETEFRDDKGVLALDGSQKVMLHVKDSRPLFLMRYDNISSMTFEEKRSKTLTIRFGTSGTPSGFVRMELSGKWRDILETIRLQSGLEIEIIEKR